MKRRPFRKGDIVCYKDTDLLYTVSENEKKIDGVNSFKLFSFCQEYGYYRSFNYRLVCAVEDRKDLTRYKKKLFKDGLKQNEHEKDHRKDS